MIVALNRVFSTPRRCPGNTHVAAAKDIAHARILRLNQDENGDGDGKDDLGQEEISKH